jgi:ribose 5-phosphate isomerase B
MTVYLGADHGGFALKEHLKTWLLSVDSKVEDCGAFSLDPADDYPQFAQVVAHKVLEHAGSFGVLLCRSGGGMEIAANRFEGVRAVQCLNTDEAKHAREHNDANVLVLPADELDEKTAERVTQTFISTQFSNEERHKKRIEMIEQN